MNQGTEATAATRDTTPNEPLAADDKRLGELLAGEYGVLASLLGVSWAASLTRTSIFLFTLSAAGVTLGFAAQGGVEGGLFRGLALVVLPIVLFLGITTFIRIVQLQREAIVYLMGMNRIRRFMADATPGSRPYFVLPLHDDVAAIYRGPGTGMPRRPPRVQLLSLVAQTQGVVGVVTAGVGAAFAGLAAAPLGLVPLSVIAAGAFVGTSVLLLVYWQRSLSEVVESTAPLYPSPQE